MKRLILLIALLLLLPSPLAAQVGNFSRVVLNGTVVSVGSGSPESSVVGSPGDVYIRTNGTIYTKTSGTATNTGWTLIASGGGSGTVTSVGLTMPGIFSVSGTPVTASGTIAASLATQTANRVWAGPTTGSPAAPTFRQVVFGDWASNSCATGQIPKYDGAAWVCDDDAGASSGAPSAAQYLTLATDATLTNERVATAGTGITLTDAGAGSTLTIAADGPNITSLSASNVSSGTLAAARGGAGASNGILKANGSGVVSAATSGTDYAPATSGSAILKGNGSGGFSSAASGTDYAPATSGSLPLFGNGSGGFTNGTVQGNTTKVVTYAGSGPATDDCAKFDANGNVTTAGAACGSGGGGSGTVTNTGTLTSGKTIVGNGTTDVTVSSLTATVVKSASGTLSAASAGTDYVAPGGALGTPSSGTATNLTGLPLAGLVAASDDQTIVSTGSAFVAKTLPSCTDTGGNHLNYDQSTNTFSCGTSGTGGASPGFVLVEQHTASTSTSLDFTSCISSTYDEYQIEIVNLLPATNNVDLWMRVSTNGGSSYDSTSTYAAAAYEQNNTGFANSGQSLASPISAYAMHNTGALNNTANYGGGTGTWRLFSPGAAIYKRVIWQMSYINNGGTVVQNNVGSGIYLSTTAVNAFQFLMSSGNIASGTIRCYGLAK